MLDDQICFKHFSDSASCFSVDDCDVVDLFVVVSCYYKYVFEFFLVCRSDLFVTSKGCEELGI